jgi:hypothetical protein
MNKPLFLIQCIAAVASLVVFSAASSAQQKTARACEAEWKANKQTIQQSGKKKRDFITECRSGAGQTAAGSPATTAPGTTSPADAPERRSATTRENTATPDRGTRRGKTVPTGAGQFASEAEAKANCPGDTVVWANTRSKVYHFPGTRTYGNTKTGAYMCERDTSAAGIRSAKNEKRPPSR